MLPGLTRLRSPIGPPAARTAVNMTRSPMPADFVSCTCINSPNMAYGERRCITCNACWVNAPMLSSVTPDASRRVRAETMASTSR